VSGGDRIAIPGGADRVGFDRFDMPSPSGMIGSDVFPPTFGAVVWEDAVMEMWTGTRGSLGVLTGTDRVVRDASRLRHGVVGGLERDMSY
jgi:hypothetical protein